MNYHTVGINCGYHSIEYFRIDSRENFGCCQNKEMFMSKGMYIPIDVG